MKAEINLQHMAKERGIVHTTMVGLDHIFSNLFDGVQVEKDQRIWLSNWNSLELRKEHVAYAAIDANLQMLCFLKLQSIWYVRAKLVDILA